MDFDPADFEDFKDFKELDENSISKSKVGWLTKTLMRMLLPWTMKRFVTELNAAGIALSKKATALFQDVDRIDIIPIRAVDVRGFQIILDNMVALYFCQEGDRFVYDGFELGPQEEGDITVFDGLWHE